MSNERSSRLLCLIAHLAVLSPLACSVPPATLVETLPVALAAGKPLPAMKLDQVYATPDDKPLLMDVFLPATHDEPAPAVILVPGGPWSSGYRAGLQGWAADMSYQGYVALAIDIRAPDVGGTVPADVVDVLSAITYIREHAGEWNIDPQRIALVGTSPASHLALFVGLATNVSIFDPNWPAGQPAGLRAVVNRGDPIDYLIDPQSLSTQQRSLFALLLSVQQIKAVDSQTASSGQNLRRDDPPVGLLGFNREDQERYQQILDFLAERLAP